MLQPLYHLADAYALVQERMAEADDPQEWMDMLDQLQDGLEAKAENICKMIRVLEADATSAEAESKRLAELASSRKASIKRLKEYLKHSLEVAGIKKLALRLFKSVQVQASPPSVKVIDEAGIHSDFWRVIPAQVVLDSGKILDIYRATGQVPDGVEIVQGTHIRIY